MNKKIILFILCLISINPIFSVKKQEKNSVGFKCSSAECETIHNSFRDLLRHLKTHITNDETGIDCFLHLTKKAISDKKFTAPRQNASQKLIREHVQKIARKGKVSPEIALSKIEEIIKADNWKDYTRKKHVRIICPISGCKAEVSSFTHILNHLTGKFDIPHTPYFSCGHKNCALSRQPISRFTMVDHTNKVHNGVFAMRYDGDAFVKFIKYALQVITTCNIQYRSAPKESLKNEIINAEKRGLDQMFVHQALNLLLMEKSKLTYILNSHNHKRKFDETTQKNNFNNSFTQLSDTEIAKFFKCDAW